MSKRTKEAREAKVKRQIEEFGGIRGFTCPQCNKHGRLVRPNDHVVSVEKTKYTTRDGNEVELLTDICGFCQEANFNKYFKPVAKRKMTATPTLQEGQSLEDVL